MKIHAIIVLAGFLVWQQAMAADYRAQVELQAHFVQFKAKDVKAIAQKGRVGLDDLQKLRNEGKSELACGPLRMVTTSGQESTVKGVTEHVYPIDFVVDRIRDAPATNETTKIEPPIGAQVGSAVLPSGFETREVGAILTATPEVTDDRKTIKIQMAAELVYETEPNIFAGKYVDSRGKATEVKLIRPVFRVFCTTTSVILEDGETTFFGSLENVAGDKVLFIFLTARVIKSEKKQDKDK